MLGACWSCFKYNLKIVWRPPGEGEREKVNNLNFLKLKEDYHQRTTTMAANDLASCQQEWSAFLKNTPVRVEVYFGKIVNKTN